MIAELTSKLSLYQDLNYGEMSGIMDELLKGQISSEEASNFLRNLTDKGESDEELLQC